MPNSTRIVWMSQHVPTPRQLAALESVFPNHTLIPDHRSFDGADDILTRFRDEHKGDEMVVVAPLSVTRELVRRGIRPLWAEMKQVPCTSTDVEVRTKRRCYRFVRFHRITAVNVTLASLAPPPSPKHGETVCIHMNNPIDCNQCRAARMK